MTGDAIVIRRVETQAEYEECVRIQDETWGAGFSERVPSAILKVSQYLGGVTAAAFDSAAADARILGFVFGMTGIRDGQLVHWSDMLAVRPEARDHGIGRRLKLYQRSLVAELGVTQILWTFDPLVSRNAHLNLNALGARVTDYVPDMYGADTGSELHQGIGTDRFVVAWEVRGDVSGAAEPALSHRAKGQRGGGAGSGDGRGEAEPALSHRAKGQRGSGAVRTGAEVLVEIPQDIQQLIVADPAAALRWRESTRPAFLRLLADGYRVAGFERSPAGGFYRLTRGSD
jgi:predicted GNAT superfamily acetyltransferase